MPHSLSTTLRNFFYLFIFFVFFLFFNFLHKYFFIFYIFIKLYRNHKGVCLCRPRSADQTSSECCLEVTALTQPSNVALGCRGDLVPLPTPPPPYHKGSEQGSRGRVGERTAKRGGGFARGDLQFDALGLWLGEAHAAGGGWAIGHLT